MSVSGAGLKAIFLLVSVAVLATGCVTHRDLARSSVQFNRAVEQGQNQMLLLNVVRASKHRPMYITSFSKVTGSNSASVTLGATDGGASTAGGTFGFNPTYDVPVLDSQEFMNGFLAPVKSGVAAYYWDQDWPQELLLHLLVQKVVVRVEVLNTGRVHNYYYWNHPDKNDNIAGQELCKLEKFTRWVNHFVTVGNPGFNRSVSSPAGPEHSTISVAETLSLFKEGYDLAPVAGSARFRVVRPSQEYVFQVAGQPSARVKIEAARQIAMQEIADWARASTSWRCNPYEIETYRVDRASPEELRDCGSSDSEDAGDDELSQREQESSVISTPSETYINQKSKKCEKTSIDIYIRSPEAVLYYLGQLARVEKSGRMPRICIGDRLQPLFVAREVAPDCLLGIVTAKYDEDWYTIPKEGEEPVPDPLCAPAARKSVLNGVPSTLFAKELACESGRSMQALSLLTQLINLQKSSKDLPTTGTVRVVGD
jgi:hypothetical protein